MKVLIIDIVGYGLDIALRAIMAGHEVKLFYKPAKYPNVGKGLVTRVADWRAHMDWADLILPTLIGTYASDLQPYFDKGYPIFGTNKNCQQLEVDREYGMQVMENCGMETLPYTKFHTAEEALAYIAASGDARYVCKPCGEAESSMSYVAKSAADLTFMLLYWKEMKKLKTPFILQEFVGGIEMAVGRWFGPKGFIGTWFENFEHKKLMNGDIGVNTGEMGTACKYVENSKLAQETLAKCEGVLKALKFVGYVDLNCIIDDKGNVWPLEWTVRFGWPLFPIQCSMHRGDPVAWMKDLLEGRDSLNFRSDHTVGVEVTIPDFPYSYLTGKNVEGFPIYGLTNDNFDDIHLNQCMAGKAPCMEGGRVVEKQLFVAAGDDLFTAVGRGSSIHRAREKVYETIKGIEIPNSPMYRTDIGQRLEKQLPELQKHGFAEEWTYE